MAHAPPALWSNDLSLPEGGPRCNLGSAAPLGWLVFYVWRRKMRARLEPKGSRVRVSRWCTFKESRSRKWKSHSTNPTKIPLVIGFMLSPMYRPDSVFFTFKLRIVFAGRNPPTLPEISSFPRNSKKSVTLSNTATLQGRGRETTHPWGFYTHPFF